MSLRVLVVDDTLLFRHLVTEVLGTIPDVEVVGSAAGGRSALHRIVSLKPDLVTLDIEMPDMNGIDVLKEMRKQGLEAGVVVVSSLTRRGGELTMRALEAGAFDFITKPSEQTPEKSRAVLRSSLEPVLKAFGGRREILSILRGSGAGEKGPKPTRSDRPVSTGSPPRPRTPLGPPPAPVGPSARALVAPGTFPSPVTPPAPSPEAPAAPAPAISASARNGAPPSLRPVQALDEVTRRMSRLANSARPEMILIGVSTGGPNALARVLPQLPASLEAPVLLVQHMPPLFTQSLAASLAPKCSLTVREAKHGETALPGTVYIAPGGKQMRVSPGGGAPMIEINDDPPENNCRPAVDYLFRSAAQHYGNRSVAVIMTGMGSDGTTGMKLLKRQGALTIAQDEASCVVFGMPKEAIRAGVVDVVAPLDELAERIARAARGEAA